MKNFSVLLPLVAWSFLMPGIGMAQTAHFERTSLVIRDGTRRTTLEEVVDLPPISSVVHTVIKRGDNFYVVVGLREWTRGEPQPRGSCGGGQEQYVEWLHVRAGKIVERQVGLYNSCAQNREGSVRGWQGGVLLWQGQGVQYLTTTDYAWTFDSAHPEAGITERMTTAAASTPPPS